MVAQLNHPFDKRMAVWARRTPALLQGQCTATGSNPHPCVGRKPGSHLNGALPGLTVTQIGAPADGVVLVIAPARSSRATIWEGSMDRRRTQSLQLHRPIASEKTCRWGHIRREAGWQLVARATS